MNKILSITFTLFSLCHAALAQFDENFYFPSKDYAVADSISHQDLFYESETFQIHTLWLKPKTEAKTTVILYMGASGNAAYYVPIANSFVALGYQVLIFEPRGYGLSTGVPNHLNVAKDAQMAFDRWMKINDIQNTQIVIYGASLGSQIATHITKNNRDQISGLIIDGGMSSFTDVALVKTPEAMKTIVRQHVTSPYSLKEDILEIRDLPKLFIHSQADETVPFSQVQFNYEHALEPKELWIHQGGHLQALKSDKAAYLQKVGEFIHTVNSKN